MAENNIEVVRSEAMKADIHAFGHAPGAEIKMFEIIAAQLGAKRVSVSRHITERQTEQHLAHPASVETGMCR